jgi:hypothetical protein
VNGAEKVSASNEAPKGPPVPNIDARAQALLSCKPGKEAQVEGPMPRSTPGVRHPRPIEVQSPSPEVRWTSLRSGADGKTTVVFGTRTAVKESILLPAAPTPKPPSTPGAPPAPAVEVKSAVQSEGAVAVRLRPHDGGLVDVELGWFSASSGKTFHHTLKDLHVARPIGGWYFASVPRIVDGGLLYRADDKVYFVDERGKVDTVSIPPGFGIDNAARVGKGWLLTESFSGDTAQGVRLAWGDEQGKQWSVRDWGLARGGSTVVALLDGKPILGHLSSSASMFSLENPLPVDPPAPIPLTVDPPYTSLCDAHASTLRHVVESLGLPARVLDPKDGKEVEVFPGQDRVTRATPSGTECSAVYASTHQGPRGETTLLAYPEAKGWTGWWFRETANPKDAGKKLFLASPVTCELGKPPGARK